MYAQHFGLSQDPFSIAPDPRYLYMSDRHREALAHLLYGVGGGGGFVLLTGDIGAGKTTVCRCFLEQIPPRCHVAYIFNPKLTVTELLQSICEEFRVPVTSGIPSGVSSLKDYIDALNGFLLNAHAQGQNNVLIIDEAQNLSADVLEQLRLLTNLETSERKLLQIVLIGQPELRGMLARPELEQLAQRVIARYHLDALSEAETAQYIQHRLGVAGLHGALPFDAVALKRIWQRSRGVPRRINLLCDRALLGAWAHGQHQVNRKVIDQAAAEVFDLDTPARPAASTSNRSALLGISTLAGAVLAAAGLYWGLNWTPSKATTTSLSTPPATVMTASGPAIPASPVASHAASVAWAASAPVSAPSPALPLVTSHAQLDAAVLDQLPSDEIQAWRDLAPLWQIKLKTGDPCMQAAQQQTTCLTIAHNGLTWPLLRQLNRPGLISLQLGKGWVYAVLVGLGPERATLRIGETLHSVPLLSLSRLWRGDFASYWRQPPDYQELQRGDKLSVGTLNWVAARLARLDGSAASSNTLDATLRSRIQSFQRTQGLKADGLPGPITLMQLGRATGSDEPTLHQPSL